MKKRNKIPLKFIDIYQREHKKSGIKKCRFYPTCSCYAKECYKNFNVFYATFLTIKRLIKCNPLHKMDYDPVPLKKEYRTKYPTLEDAFISERLKRRD